MGKISVRAREPGDVEAIVEIFRCPGVIAGTLQLPYRSLEERLEMLVQRTPDSHNLVAEVDRRVVGALGLHLESNPRRRHCGHMGMAVHDDCQGQGVGSALMAAMIDLADNWLDLRRIELSVFVDNAPAIHLYQKFGFVIEGTARGFGFRDGVDCDAHMMARLRPRS